MITKSFLSLECTAKQYLKKLTNPSCARGLNLCKYAQVVTKTHSHPQAESNETYFKLHSTLSHWRAETAVFIQQEKGNINFPLCCGTSGHARLSCDRNQRVVSVQQEEGGRAVSAQTDAAGTHVHYSVTPDEQTFPSWHSKKKKKIVLCESFRNQT